MVVNEQRFLDIPTRKILYKNEIDELRKLDKTNKKFNRIAISCVGGIIVIGLSVISTILI